MAVRLAAADADFQERFEALLGAKREVAAEVGSDVADILTQVREGGDGALIALTKRFDDVELTPDTLAIGDGDMAAAERECPKEALAALDAAARRIEAYHDRQMPADADFSDAEGVRLGWRWRPVQRRGWHRAAPKRC